MAMITELKPEWEARIDEWRDKWLAIGLSCEPVDVEAAKKAITLAYEVVQLQPPEDWYFELSPLAAQERCNKLVNPNYPNTFEVYNCCYGNHEAAWAGFNDFFLEVVGLDLKLARGLIETAKHSGWWIPYDKFCIITDRPAEINRDERLRLHNENGAAVLYRDGFGIYAIHGVRVPEELIKDPSSNTVEVIANESNAEVRRVRITRYGYDRYLQDAGFTMFQKDDFGTLYRKEIAGEPTLVFVEVINSTPEPDGTFKKYVLPCRSTVRTAHEAVAQSFGLTPESYNPEIET